LLYRNQPPLVSIRSSSSKAPIFKYKLVIDDYRGTFKSSKLKQKKFDCANEAILTGTLIAKIIADLRILMYWLEKQSFFGHLF